MVIVSVDISIVGTFNCWPPCFNNIFSPTKFKGKKSVLYGKDIPAELILLVKRK